MTEERPGSGSAERELATPETAVQGDAKKQGEAPEAKEMETSADEDLPDDQQAMQPDTD